MFESLIFLFLILRTTFSQPQSTSFTDIKSEIKSLAEEFVRLHLVEELSYASQLVETLKGRNWMVIWANKRIDIVNKILLFNDDESNLQKCYDDWRERLKYFQDSQVTYLQTLIKNFDVRRRPPFTPWTKINFDPITGKTIVNPIQAPQLSDDIYDLADPIVTEDEIDLVMSLHRPLTDNERLTEAEVIPANSKYGNNKKYHVINQKMLHDLLKARYTLIKETLRGKRKSELSYQTRIFQADRVMAQISIWIKNKIDPTSVDQSLYYKQRLLTTSKISTDNVFYRKYLNLAESQFQGNLFIGFDNRYDDPEKHGLNFDVNSESIIGKHYKPMRDLAKEIRAYDISSVGFTRRELKDLPLIETFIERFKSLTFWNDIKKFQMNQWFKVPILKSEQVYVIKPPIKERSTNLWNMYKTVEKKLTKSIQLDVDSFNAYSMYQRSEIFLNQLTYDINILRAESLNTASKHKIIFNDRILHYTSALQTSNLMELLSLKTPMDSFTFTKHPYLTYGIYHEKINVETQKSRLDELNEKKKKSITEEIINSIRDLNNLNSNEILNRLNKRPIYETVNSNGPSDSTKFHGNGGDGESNFLLNHHSYTSGIGETNIKRHKHH